MKFILLVEGDAERVVLPRFFERWLNPKLQRRVGIKAVKLSGSGGYIKEVVKWVTLQLNAPKQQEIIAVLGLLDLYGLPNNFCPHNLTSAQARYDWAKRELENRVGQAKFQQFFAVHELEAWLLSDPNIFPREIRESLPANVANPEAINFNQPPAMLLGKLFWKQLKQPYQKPRHGLDLFIKLDPAIAYQKCPRLQELPDEMLRLAQASGC